MRRLTWFTTFSCPHKSACDLGRLKDIDGPWAILSRQVCNHSCARRSDRVVNQAVAMLVEKRERVWFRGQVAYAAFKVKMMVLDVWRSLAWDSDVQHAALMNAWTGDDGPQQGHC